jgi:hypothetical protein
MIVAFIDFKSLLERKKFLFSSKNISTYHRPGFLKELNRKPIRLGALSFFIANTVALISASVTSACNIAY